MSILFVILKVSGIMLIAFAVRCMLVDLRYNKLDTNIVLGMIVLGLIAITFL